MVGVFIVLVAVVITVFLVKRGKAPGTVFAPAGQMISGFPKELLLSGAKLSGSYAINYSSSMNQYTATWESTSSVAELYNYYLAFLKGNNWDILNRFTQYSNSRGFSVAHGSSTATIAISSQNGGSEVTISYLPVSPSPIREDVVDRAAKGMLVEEFPPALVLAKDAVIQDSYESKSSNSNSRKLVTVYDAKLSSADLEQEYLSYFKENNYQVGNDVSNKGQVLMSATKNGASVDINAYSSPDNSALVTVTLTIPALHT